MKNFKKLKHGVLMLLMLLALSCASTAILPAPITVEAATIKINKTKITLDKGYSYQLKIKGTTKKVTWKSNKPSVAKVSSKGLVTAKKAGTAKITAKVSGKKYACTVIVKNPTTSKPEEPEKSGREALKEYILEYGRTNSDDNKFIRYDYDNEISCAIVYERDRDAFSFLMFHEKEDEDLETSIEMIMPVNRNTNITTVGYIYIDSDLAFESVAKVNIAAYSAEDEEENIDFVVTSPDYLSSADEEYAYTIANLDFRIASLVWSILLDDHGFAIRDVGFLRM